MDSDINGVVAFDRPSVADSGLRCPECEYNLTGLTDPRCPECGTTFDWDEVRQAAACPPRIAFERARRWRKIPAFWVTWATVLFAPWIFARQIIQRSSWRHGLAFGAICFAGTALAYFSDLDTDFHATWLCTAIICILAQSLWLSLFDPAVWRAPRATLRFWMLAGCYTSAVMLTEVVQGPPPLFLEDLWSLVTGEGVNGWFGGLFDLGLPAVVCWSQIGVWLIALCCIYAKRVARRPASARVVALAIVVGLSLLILYAAMVQWVGRPLLGWVADWL